MGIQGLLPLLKSIHKPTHVRNFAGQTLAIDAYGWLHRGTVSCAIELAKGEPTRKHIDFALHRVRMLIHFGVKPYLVFDGDYLPSKAHTEKERAAKRKESKRVGLEMLRMGRPSQAQLELQKAVDVTPAMARELIEELKQLDVPYVVAPYEADSQMAYLEKKGMVDGVISEDSDLLVFGVQCLLTKLDQYGECVMINRADFTSCRDISLLGWTDREFRIMAMLSGCDYLPGIDKMGLKTAYRLVRKHKTLDRVVRTLQFDGKMRVPKGYLEDFSRAEKTFLYQWVFCPKDQRLTHLNQLPNGLTADSMPFIGKPVDPELAAGVACGDLDPNTKKPIVLPQRFYHPASRQRTVQTPNEKPDKPIDEFFKKRIPLAELDPNSFTPSPSQTHLLESQAGRSWSASQVTAPRVFGTIRSANALPPSTAPQASRRVATDPSPSLHRASPKRQRLCSDSGIAAALRGTASLESSTSRFFGKQPAQASPSLRKKSGGGKQEEFELWSDDSVAEAVAAATATSESTQETSTHSQRKRKKLSVFVDTPDTGAGMTGGSQATFTATNTSIDPRRSSLEETPDTSFESTTSSRERSVFSKGLSLEMFALGKQDSSTPRRTPSRTHSAPVAAKTPSLVPVSDITSKTVNCPPELLSVDDSGIVLESPPGTGNELFPSDQAEADDDDIADETWIEMECRLIDTTSKGSEDLLVPESPEAVLEEATSRKSLDLSRFSFAG
ncbi:hypothetical protein AC578_728 [Pseudocercospora eumusae]|uniref:Uncharacterized protein n=1 Tax=Pseudocercospora eumusae TaxID=321146 RepID=A0A139HMQ5_9PEZI|nr:hypothetical protein AC578_728 [Pseudocercospora eumusae]